MPRTIHQKDGQQRPRRVQVARTLVEPQPELSGFLDSVGRHLVRQLGRKVIVSTMGSLHITLLESLGATSAFSQHRFTPQDVHSFYVELQQYLSDIEGTRDTTVVSINPERPLKWFGRRQDKLGFNVLPNEALRQERAYIEEFLLERFGELPSLNPLYEHVVFAGFTPNAVSSDAQRNPEMLLPDGAIIPEQLAVNGLVVYLNGMGDAYPSN